MLLEKLSDNMEVGNGQHLVNKKNQIQSSCLKIILHPCADIQKHSSVKVLNCIYLMASNFEGMFICWLSGRTDICILKKKKLC